MIMINRNIYYYYNRVAHFVRISVEPHDFPTGLSAVLPVERLHGTARAVLRVLHLRF